jgi:hypothetical protein
MADNSNMARLRPMQDWITPASSHITNFSHVRIANASAATALLPWDDDNYYDNDDDDDNDDDNEGDNNDNDNNDNDMDNNNGNSNDEDNNKNDEGPA